MPNDVTEASVARALEIEHEIQHDLMAEVRAYAEQCPIGGGIIHLGATSMDIEDNADALRLRDALDLTLASLRKVMTALDRQSRAVCRLAGDGLYPFATRRTHHAGLSPGPIFARPVDGLGASDQRARRHSRQGV